MISKRARQYITGFLFLVVLSACEQVNEHRQPTAYFNAAIYDEHKRIPLVYPFEINAWENDASLRTWSYYDNKSTKPIDIDSQTTRIIRFAQTNNYVFGERDTGWVRPSGEIQYFIFSLTQTNVVRFSDKKDFLRYCATFGGDIEQMRPFIEQWEDYWRHNTKQK